MWNVTPEMFTVFQKVYTYSRDESLEVQVSQLTLPTQGHSRRRCYLRPSSRIRQGRPDHSLPPHRE